MDKPLRSNRLLGEAGSIAYSFGIIGLSLMGMAGLIYHTLAPDGALSPWILSLWARHPFFATLVLIGLVAMVLAARTGDFGVRGGRSRSEMPLYVFVGLGTLFAGRLIVLGTF
jgi:hypothetical protein